METSKITFDQLPHVVSGLSEKLDRVLDLLEKGRLREEAMMVGSKQEQDSIKALTVRLERHKHAERTHVYFRPSDTWTPESKSFW